MTQLPLIKVFDDGHSYRFFCSSCRKWHNHGRGNGIRTAHCWTRYHGEDGYEIRAWTKTERKWIRAWLNRQDELEEEEKKYQQFKEAMKNEQRK